MTKLLRIRRRKNIYIQLSSAHIFHPLQLIWELRVILKAAHVEIWMRDICV